MQAIKQFFKTHPHAWWGFYLPVYLAAFFIIEHFITDNYWATQTVLDSYVPFCEWFIFPYVSWSPLLVVLGVYLILKDGEGFRRYMWYIMVTFTTAVVFCILIPNGQDLRPAVMEHHNLAAWLVEYTYSIDTNTNVFPSVHVVGAIGAAWAVKKTPSLERRTLLRGATAILALLICLSTLFIKQHAVLDVIGGLGLALAVGLPLYHHGIIRRSRPAMEQE
ncbi:MAG: phosphatase PAP2 family protein [Vescimonas sp.]|uniref:phosphatase PAP2 family protein n=1 Tax=Vescimonas sp. TaxID=2892404 RepID=UPI002A90E270|nr:phosphatase PAP2 family protein [Vescimonas sp.]MDY5333702.1 phosphatase PAP2 family protein [Vescimonas sp.]